MIWTTLSSVPPGPVVIRLDRGEALELLAVVQATLNAISRSNDLVVGAAILTGIRQKIVQGLEEGS